MAIIGNNSVESTTVSVNNTFSAYMNTQDTYTAVSGDEVTDFQLYCADGDNTAETMMVGVYDITSGANGATLVGSATIDPNANTAGWYTVSVNIALTAGQTYAVAWAAPLNGNFTLYRDTTAGVGSHSFESSGVQDLTTGADPWVEVSNGTNRHYSYFATVTNSGGGGSHAPVPGTGSSTITGYDSTVNIQSGPISISIGAGSIAFTTYDITDQTGENVEVPVLVGSAVYSTNDISFNIGYGIPEGQGPQDQFPDDGELGITGQTPVSNLTYNESMLVGSITITSYAPTADSGQGTFIEINVGSITITGNAPIDETSYVPSPTTGSIATTSYVPLVGTSHVRTPDTIAVTITTYTPSPSASGDIYISIDVGTITSASSAPSLIRGAGRHPDAGLITFTSYTPDAISEDVSWEFFPDEGSATYSTYDLTLSIIEVNKSIPIAVGSLVIPGWKPPFGSSPSVEVGARKRRKILGFLK